MYLLLRADQRLKQDHEDVLRPAHLQELYLSVKDLGLILSQKLIRLSLAPCQNDWVLFFVMVIHLEKKMERLNSGDYKIIFGTNLRILDIGLMKCGRVEWQEAEATRKKIQYCTDPSGQAILYLRGLQGHSGRNPIDPTLQDNVLIPNNFFEYIYLIGCAINLHSITNSGLIPGGHFEQKTDSILHVCGSYEQRTQRSKKTLTWKYHVLHGTNRNSGKYFKTRCIGST